MKTFAEKVLDVVKKIPKGETLSYKQVAKMAGNENASRAVGMIMSKNQNKSIPCHRVIRSDGKVGGYNGLKGNKTELLSSEQINKISQSKVD